MHHPRPAAATEGTSSALFGTVAYRNGVCGLPRVHVPGRVPEIFTVLIKLLLPSSPLFALLKKRKKTGVCLIQSKGVVEKLDSRKCQGRCGEIGTVLHTMLVGMSDGAATVENILQVLHTALPCGSAVYSHAYNQEHSKQTFTHTLVPQYHGSILHSSRKLETTQMPVP